jgi:hypothetical protein
LKFDKNDSGKDAEKNVECDKHDERYFGHPKKCGRNPINLSNRWDKVAGDTFCYPVCYQDAINVRLFPY